MEANDVPPFTLHIYNFTTQQFTGYGEEGAHLTEKSNNRGRQLEHAKDCPRLGHQHQPKTAHALKSVEREALRSTYKHTNKGSPVI